MMGWMLHENNWRLRKIGRSAAVDVADTADGPGVDALVSIRVEFDCVLNFLIFNLDFYFDFIFEWPQLSQPKY